MSFQFNMASAKFAVWSIPRMHWGHGACLHSNLLPSDQLISFLCPTTSGAAWPMEHEVATPSDMLAGVNDRCFCADQHTYARLVAAKAAKERARSHDLYCCKPTQHACTYVPSNCAYSIAMHSDAYVTTCHGVVALTLYWVFLVALSSSSRQRIVYSSLKGMWWPRRWVFGVFVLSVAFIVFLFMRFKPYLILVQVCVCALQSTTVWAI